MTSPFGPMHIIVNPSAGRGAGARALAATAEVLNGAGYAYEVTTTERPGHGTEAVRAAIDAGCRFVVAVGGDGTVNEVVNGIMGAEAALDPEVVLGVVPAGSGCDFVRTFGLPQLPADAARHLLGETTWGRIDVARVTTRDEAGADVPRWFANIGEAGLGAEIVEIAARMPKWLGAAVYRAATLRGLRRHKPATVTLTLHGRKARGRVDAPLEDVTLTEKASMVVFANCQFFGGGMRVAPRAIPGDGMLDIMVWTGSKTEVFTSMPKMGKGQHVPSKTIRELLATSLTIEADRPVLIEADGELLGTTPATVTCVPAAFRMKV